MKYRAIKKEPNKTPSGKRIVLGYYGLLNDNEIKKSIAELFNDYELYFINYKNSIIGTGGVGTVTRSMLNSFNKLNMICHDGNLENPLYMDKGVIYPVGLNNSDEKNLHANYSKLYLWPVLHNLPTPVLKKEVIALRISFLDASKKFAQGAIKYLKGKKNLILWINDYVLCGSVSCFRELKPKSKIIFSWRTPFGKNELPKFTQDDLRLIIESVVQADIITFQREKDLINFLLSTEKISKENRNIKVNWENFTIRYRDHITIPRVYPMGNDPKYRKILALSKDSTRVKNHFIKLARSPKIVVCISRFDKTKGIDFEINTINLFFKIFPEFRRKVTFIRVSYLSELKKSTPYYKNFYKKIQKFINKVNQSYGVEGWSPIVNLTDKELNDIEVTGLFRAADVFLLMSLADGFNHLSVESVLSKLETDRPIQILMGDIGASDYLEGYIQIDPLDLVGTAIKIKKALNIESNEAKKYQRKILNSANKLYSINWAISVVQSVVDIEKVPKINKFN